jgi:1-acyl-sn-glycerol-3-phosphate acyltransferase
MPLPSADSIHPAQLSAWLPVFLGSVLDGADVAERATQAVAPLTASWSEQDAARLLEHVACLGQAHRLYPANPLARDISRAWSSEVFAGSYVEGLEHLRLAASRGPVALIGNHLSYADSTAMDALLAQAGATQQANAIVSLAGPKVYADTLRRFAAACLNTIPVPQSSSLGHTAQVPARELAARARAAIDAAEEALGTGHILLIYGEGSRSRTGRLSSFLPGVAKYLRLRDIQVVPFAIDGTQHSMPIGTTRLRSCPVTVRFGAPVSVSDHETSRDALGWVHGQVAELLPADLRPAPHP